MDCEAEPDCEGDDDESHERVVQGHWVSPWCFVRFSLCRDEERGAGDHPQHRPYPKADEDAAGDGTGFGAHQHSEDRRS